MNYLVSVEPKASTITHTLKTVPVTTLQTTIGGDENLTIWYEHFGGDKS